VDHGSARISAGSRSAPAPISAIRPLRFAASRALCSVTVARHSDDTRCRDHERLAERLGTGAAHEPAVGQLSDGMTGESEETRGAWNGDSSSPPERASAR